MSQPAPKKVLATCPRCGGAGYLNFRYANGICFQCKGAKMIEVEESSPIAPVKVVENVVNGISVMWSDYQKCWMASPVDGGPTVYVYGPGDAIGDRRANIPAAMVAVKAVAGW